MTNIQQHYDTIIIGSGMGALACASLLAQRQKQRVLILERHFKVGGFTHAFVRKGRYEWDVGIHYIGDMGKGMQSRAVFDYITQGQVKWQKLPDCYDCFEFPDFSFAARSGKRNLQNDLIDQFPHEKKAIDQYFVDLKRAGKWFQNHVLQSAMPAGLNQIGNLLKRGENDLALMTTRDYLDTHFTDPRLKAVLVSQWGDYGLPPAQSAFVMQALVAGHYLKGAWFPVGGGKVIASSIVPIIEQAGGKVLVNHTVQEILIQDKQAVGVRVLHQKGNQQIEKTFFADTIISNAGAILTYLKLIPPEIEIPFRAEIRDFPDSMGHVTLHVGFKDDPRQLGFQGENHWMFASLDHDVNNARRNELLNGEVSLCFMSFPSMKNPQARGHTAELIAPVDAEPFREWHDAAWLKRGTEYDDLKARISQALLDFVEARYPGFRDLIDYTELSTPLTTEHFTGFKNGAIYGLPGVPQRFQMKWLGPRTPIKNLYLTGADAMAPGLVGALNSGVLTASLILGLRGNFLKLIADARKYSEALPEEEEER